MDIGKALNGLFNEVRAGTAHLNAAKSLAKAADTHPIIMRVSPSFFNLSTHAHLEAAQLCAARVFDKTGDCAGIPWMVDQIRDHPETFGRSDDEKKEVIAQVKQVLADKASLLIAIKHRRDRWLAHLDKRTLKDPDQFARDAKLTYPELEDLFQCATGILNIMADLYGTAGFLIFPEDYDDLSKTLDLVQRGVEANAQDLERRIGPPDTVGSF
jgi:hypothetical protein